MFAKFVFAPDADVSDALARGGALLTRVKHDDISVALLVAELVSGPALALGRHQAVEQALNDESVRESGTRVVRRRTGGPAVDASTGVMYVALALRNAATLLACPPDRVLNRNVRALLPGMSIDGHLAHYFGRDFISVDRVPVASVGWARDEDGAVLLEAFVGASRVVLPPQSLDGYASRRSTPRWLGKEPTTMRALLGREVRGEELFASLTRGLAQRFSVVPHPDEHIPPITAVHVDARTTEPADGRFGHDVHKRPLAEPREAAIGFVSAAVALDSADLVSDVTLLGDFFADDALHDAFCSALVGRPADRAHVSRAVAATFFPSGTHVVEGVRELDTFVAVVCEAALAARPSP